MNSISRRTALQLLGVGGAGLAAAACTNTSGSSSGGTSDQPKNVKWSFPDTGAKIPSGDVKMRWVDSGDRKAVFFNAFFPAYHDKHSNVSVDYQGNNWNTIQQVVSTGVRNGTAPDVFQLPPQITFAQAVNNKWIGAFDDVVPNWSEVKARYPVGVFADGITDVNGKTYGMPVTGNKRINNLLLFDQDIAKKAGYDPGSQILTWDDFRTLAKKATKQGGGKYYGIIFGMAQEGQLAGPISSLAEMAGVAGGVDASNGISAGIDWRTGEFNYTHDITIELIELLLALRDDKSVFPGSVSLDAATARGRFPQGVSAMMLQGPWNIAQWKQDNPDFPLGINLPPQRDPKKIAPLAYGPGGSNVWYYASNTKAGPVIGDIFAYLSTEAGQVQFAKYDGAGDPPQFPNAIANADLDSLQQKALKLGTQYTVIRPEPATRNPDVTQAYLANVPVSPNFDQTLVGLYTKQIKKSPKAAMKDLLDRTNKGREDAIKKARSRGAKVSLEDWVFKDWNPQQPYTKLYQK